MNKSAEDDFRSFVEGRWPRLLRTAYLLTGHHQDAEDLVQAALARAYTRWERVRNARDPEAYVWRILINTNADRIRRRRLGEWLTQWLPERAAPDRTDQLVERSLLLDALRRLPARQRATVVLRYLEDRSETEVAELLGTGVGTVRSHTARALARLRAELPRLTTSETV
ncbi:MULTISPECIES: SigE family RNA polymerase sigma factor [unclassified Streptomyces]|uniref:SigE family RNA polymerase sigma factor n=1 Tax=unclassified Streptomyces TaxID=2593676 RepID=UPI0022B63D0B|nr:MULTISPECIES: SigE family RNA polymerase sigma factor [unclassified Streptomyces]MCZ7416361.1 SigE family RNA polymerase sigma factor [Streptomyces sp. WMMC897]MCZ7433829.1 SigE family RNA polymerase sigma factor [Streptomyces sp. WMMC1477]